MRSYKPSTVHDAINAVAADAYLTLAKVQLREAKAAVTPSARATVRRFLKEL